MNEPEVNRYYETREFFGIYEYRTSPTGSWRACKDENGNIMRVPKVPKIVQGDLCITKKEL